MCGFNINVVCLFMLVNCLRCREEEERLRAEREAAAAEARGPSVRRRRGFEPPVRDHCLLDAADEPESSDGPVAVPVRPPVSHTEITMKTATL